MKTPIGEVLKTMRDKKEKPKVNICSCGAPPIWTFAFAYKEYLCLECRNTYGMMGAEDTEETPELKYKKYLYEKLWKALYGKRGFLPRSNYGMKGCKKCTGANHREHLSEKEIIEDKIATDVLTKLTKPL